jgi:NAD(P)-dependent dehydrogenase (short-subunit alcohol dehydrogenase family)
MSVDRFSRIDVLVNNAGILTERYAQPTTDRHFIENYEVNVLGVWRMTQALVPHFKEYFGGKVVIIASIAGHSPYADTPAYCASKASVINLMRSLAITLGPYNINVNAVCPGAIPTEMTMQYRKDMPNLAELEPTWIAMAALKRHADPEDIGAAAVFLASPNAKNISGQCLNVDGGATLY